MVKAKQGARRLELVRLADLVPADRNAKAHDAGLIAGSMSRFGYIEPIVIDERTGKLIAGHGRREELLTRQAEGGEAPEGVEVVDGEWSVPVMRGWASKDDNEADAAAIALNRVGERGGWNRTELADILEDLAVGSDVGLDGLGYTEDDVLELQRELGELAKRDSDFLGDLVGDEKPPNPLAQDKDRSTGSDVVELRLPMTKAERDESMLLLRRHQRALGTETLALTLIHILKEWKAEPTDG